MKTYYSRSIDDVRDKIIGLKVIDVEERGKVLHLEDENGKTYSVDFTGEHGVVVYEHPTESERLQELEELFSSLLEKLNISEEDLWKLIE